MSVRLASMITYLQLSSSDFSVFSTSFSSAYSSAMPLTVERGCGRLEGCCLNWNQPSIDFYLSLGSTPLDEWTTCRLTGDRLNKFAEFDKGEQ